MKGLGICCKQSTLCILPHLLRAASLKGTDQEIQGERLPTFSWLGRDGATGKTSGPRSEPFPLTGLLDLQRKDVFLSSPDVYTV